MQNLLDTLGRDGGGSARENAAIVLSAVARSNTCPVTHSLGEPRGRFAGPCKRQQGPRLPAREGHSAAGKRPDRRGPSSGEAGAGFGGAKGSRCPGTAAGSNACTAGTDATCSDVRGPYFLLKRNVMCSSGLTWMPPEATCRDVRGPPFCRNEKLW